MAITLVASVTAATSPHGFTTAAINTTGANLLVISASWYSGSTADVTVSDSKGNTWYGLTKHTGPTDGRHRFFYTLSPTVGSGHTFTVSGTSTYSALIVYAFSGVSGGFDSESGSGHATTSPVASGSVTPLTNGALILTGMASNDPATDAVSPGGFTQTTVPAVGGVSMQNSSAYVVQPTAAAINPTWSWTGSHTIIAVSTAVFRSLPPPTTPPLVATITRSWGGPGAAWAVPDAGGTTDPIDTTGANLLVLCVGWYWNSSVTPTISDSKGNTWIALTRHSGLFAGHQFFYAKNAAVGTGHTFTVTASGVYPVVVVYAFSGAHATAPFDVQNGAGTTTGTGSLATGAITPAANGAVLVSGLQYADGTPASVTVNTALASALTVLAGSAAAYTVQATAAAINPTWGYAGSSQGAAVSIAAFTSTAAPAAGETAESYVWGPL